MELEQHINGSGNLDLSGVGSVVTLKDGTKIRAPETSRIAYEDEPRLMLLREWSLFDSMLCSSYVKVSAADVVYGVTALLESLNSESKDSKESSAAEQFWVAYSALSLSNVDQLRKGMQSAIEIQRAILRQGSSAITKTGFIRSAKKFRPLPSSASFLMDALKERGARVKPLICACLAKEPEKVLVVGVCGKPRLGAVQGNAFGNAFRSVAEEIGANYFHDMFESSWIVLDVVAVSSFMIRLTEKL
ncbi:hypothetical protein HU200_066569 [Digitaria exilis]|uniref:Uncharacterized protein n=1 Tax=Digitaria exilis TaxID=1010633 RepID=A0A835DTV3_9POAL|nr:hypothetical protein HU200_066569 [Digitaria exilis]